MNGQKLDKYLDSHSMTQSALSRYIGQSRQKVSHWVKIGATVELTDIGLRIRSPIDDRILYETQVAK